MYAPTLHFRQRVNERDLSDEAIAAALAGREVECGETTFHYSPSQRVVLVVKGRNIVTAYKVTKREVKRVLSR